MDENESGWVFEPFSFSFVFNFRGDFAFAHLSVAVRGNWLRHTNNAESLISARLF